VRVRAGLGERQAALPPAAHGAAHRAADGGARPAGRGHQRGRHAGDSRRATTAALRHWIAYRAYLKPDEDTYRPDKAKEAMALFEQEFGPKSSAIDEAWIQREQFEGDGTY
jgi:hypothetical protein